jgi:predicted DNA-binding transcriptional regulator AlpA
MSVPAYVSRKRCAAELDMSADTFDRYVREGVLPGPKIRGGLKRWRWIEVAAALECGAASIVTMEQDPFSEGVARAKAASEGTAPKIRSAGNSAGA